MVPLATCLVFCALLPGAGAPPLDEISGTRSSVIAMGDVDDDGVDDFALALRRDDADAFGPTLGVRRSDLGKVLLLSGADGSSIRHVRRPAASDEQFGRAMAHVGDADGDGVSDLAVADARDVWLVSGTTGEAWCALGGPFAGEGFGASLVAGDLNGDGANELLVLCSRYPVSKSVALVYSLSSGTILRAFGSTERPAHIESKHYTRVRGGHLLRAIGLLELEDGRVAVAVGTRQERKSESTGTPPAQIELFAGLSGEFISAIALGRPISDLWCIVAPGDLDLDGSPDVLASTAHFSLQLFSGATGAEIRNHSYAAHYMNGEGMSLDVIGDIDGDGVSDYVMGANEEAFDCDPGGVVLYSGATGAVLHRQWFEYTLFDEQCGPGVDTCALGDLDGDGIRDFVMHLPRLREARVHSGATFALLYSVDLEPDSPVLQRQ